jgi:hypothetical protein
MTQGFVELSDLLSVTVGAYELNVQDGLTVSVLSESTNQDKFLSLIPNFVNEMNGILISEYNISLDETNAPHTWDVHVIDSEYEDQKIINAIVREDDQLRFGKQGTERIAMAFGPGNWRPFGEPRSTPLSQVIHGHTRTVDIDFAISLDFRSVLVGASEISRKADKEGSFTIPTSPSAKNSLLFGTTETGTYIEFKSDLYGMAKLIGQVDKATSSKGKTKSK